MINKHIKSKGPEIKPLWNTKHYSKEEDRHLRLEGLVRL
jgi:hypothetical protein